MNHKFGCCLAVGSFVPQANHGEAPPSGIPQQIRDGLSALERSGYDFAELTVRSLTSLTEEEFAETRRLIRQSAVQVPVCNSFIPPELKLTGPGASDRDLEAYLDLAMKRVKDIGGEQIVFGSGAARNVPDGFPVERGMEQLKHFLRRCEEYAAAYGITVAIEPLNRGESNVINTVREAMSLAMELDLPHIKVLADCYHMDLEDESFAVLEEAVSGKLLSHVHISGRNRRFPGAAEGQEEIDFAHLFRILQTAGYTGGVSAECGSQRFSEESAKSLRYVRAVWAQANIHE